MSKVLKCGDVMSGCEAVIEGKDVDEVIAKAAEHAKTNHGMVAVNPRLVEQVEKAIKDK